MFVPIGDSPNPRGYTPWITYGLIAANVLVYLALLPLGWRAADPSAPEFAEYVRTVAIEQELPRSQWRALASQMTATTSAYDLLVFERGFRPVEPSWFDALTAMFLHGGLAHLLGNMLFLWIYGDNVEYRLGRWRFLVAYLATGLAATGGDAMLRWGSGIPSVGASGAISGVLGLYFLWFPRNRVQLLALFPLGLLFEWPARIVLGFYLVFNNILPWLVGGSAGGVSYGAHIGGFIAGSAVAFAADRVRLLRPEADLRRGRPAGAPADPAAAFRAELDAGRLREAAALLFELPRAKRRRIAAGDAIRLGDELLRVDHPRGALAAYQRAIADHPDDPLVARAHLHAARTLMDRLEMPIAAYQHLHDALDVGLDPADATLARSLIEALDRRANQVPRRLTRRGPSPRRS